MATKKELIENMAVISADITDMSVWNRLVEIKMHAFVFAAIQSGDEWRDGLTTKGQ